MQTQINMEQLQGIIVKKKSSKKTISHLISKLFPRIDVLILVIACVVFGAFIGTGHITLEGTHKNTQYVSQFFSYIIQLVINNPITNYLFRLPESNLEHQAIYNSSRLLNYVLGLGLFVTLSDESLTESDRPLIRIASILSQIVVRVIKILYNIITMKNVGGTSSPIHSQAILKRIYDDIEKIMNNKTPKRLTTTEATEFKLLIESITNDRIIKKVSQKVYTKKKNRI
jgi:hypothetical protein